MARAALLLLGLAAGGLAVVTITTLAIRVPRVTLTAFLISFVFINYQLSGRAATDYPLTVSIGSVQVNALDAFTIAFAVAVVIQVRRVPIPLAAAIPASVLTLIVVACVFSGILELGIESGVNSWRQWILAVATMWWSLVSLPRLGRRVLGPFIVAGLVASAAQAFGFITRGFGGVVDPVLVNGHATDPRPVHATAALLMTTALVAVLAGITAHSFVGRALLGTWLLASIVVSQQRTVWLATVAALIALGAMNYRSSRNKALIAVGSAYVAAILAIGFVAAANLSSSIANSASNADNFWYRSDLWSDRLATERSLPEWIFGGVVGFGEAGWNNMPALSSHNMLVEAVTTLGIVGTVVVALLMATAITNTPPEIRASVIPILIAIIVIGVTYQWPTWAWCFIAIGCAGVQAGAEPLDHPSQPSVLPLAPDQQVVSWHLAAR